MSIYKNEVFKFINQKVNIFYLLYKGVYPTSI